MAVIIRYNSSNRWERYRLQVRCLSCVDRGDIDSIMIRASAYVSSAA